MFDKVPLGGWIFLAAIALGVIIWLALDVGARRKDDEKKREAAAAPAPQDDAPPIVASVAPPADADRRARCKTPGCDELATVRRARLEVRRTAIPWARGDHAAFPAVTAGLVNPMAEPDFCRRCALDADRETERFRFRMRVRMSDVARKVEEDTRDFEAMLTTRLAEKSADRVRVKRTTSAQAKEPTPIRRVKGGASA